VGAVRRLSTRHDARQDEVDALLRNDVFIDLCQIVRQGLRIGESSYSLKTVERLYRPKRSTEVGTAMDSIVQYARWIESRQPGDWRYSPILNSIRDYNKDDCRSTAELLEWLRKMVIHHQITAPPAGFPINPLHAEGIIPEIETRLDTAAKLRAGDDPVSMVLADLIDFHRREEKPMWWRMFDRAKATTEELYDDPACLAGLSAVGSPEVDKQSLIQAYRFDPSQECKLAAGDRSRVMFTHNLNTKFTLWELDLSEGILKLKIGKKHYRKNARGYFLNREHYFPTNMSRQPSFKPR
jgi:hypothetical protein